MKNLSRNRLSIVTDLKRLQRNRIYLVMMVLLLVGALIWVMTTILRVEDSSEVTQQAIKFSTPINPNLETEVFTTVENKRYLPEAELEAFPINRLIKDRSGNYVVIPFDTPKEEVEALITGTTATPRPTVAPVISAPATPASGSSTTN